MTWEDEFAPVDEASRRQFETEVRADRQPNLVDFLPPADSHLYAGTLEELVMIEMEYRWSHMANSGDAPPLVEGYLQRFPGLANSDSLSRLLEEEVQVRIRYDAVPPLEEYERRFPQVDLGDTFRKLMLDTLPETPNNESGVSVEFTPARRYSRIQKHAAGGMGVVYRALDEQMDREVALKHLQRNAIDDSEGYARFLNEAKLAGSLEHPGVVPVYELGESDDGSPFYAMKLVEGQTLEELIREVHAEDYTGRLRELLQVLVSVANTIAFAHARGVIHRDIKPANIIVGKFGETVILDWGLAKKFTSADSPEARSEPQEAPDIQLTQVGSILGTPAYMAPEQADGSVNTIDYRADIYALGAVLFQILAGRPSIETQRDFEKLRLGHRPLPPSHHHGGVPKALEAICGQAMEISPNDRYASAVEFAKDIDRFLADESLTAYKDPWITLAGRWARKHKSIVGSAIALLLATSVASVAIAFERQASLEERRRKIATTQAVMDSNLEAALGEIQAGRFQNGVVYLGKAIEIVEKDASFGEQLRFLKEKHNEAQNLVDFHQLVDRAEVLAWDEQDDDMIVLLQKALHLLGVFEHRDWWNHLTDFDLDPEIEDQLRNRVYREICMLIGIQLKKVANALESPEVLLRGGNQRSRQEFAKAEVPMEAALRFRPGLGLEFAQAFMEQQKAPGILTNARLATATMGILDHKSFRNATDRFFVGLCLVFYSDALAYAEEGDTHQIVELTAQTSKMLKGMIGLEQAATSALGHLRTASAEEPQQFWTLFSQAWAAERTGYYGEAITAYTGCLAQKPTESRSYLHRSRDYMILGNNADTQEDKRLHWHRAIRDLDRGIHLTPAFVDLYRWKFDDLQVFEDDAAKIACLVASLDAMRFEAPQESNLHTAFQVEMREYYISRYLSFAESVIEQHPEWQEAWLAKSFAYLHMQDIASSKRCLEEAQQRLAGESTVEALLAGQLAFAEEDFEAAAEHFRRCLSLDETEFLAYRGLALVSESTQSAGATLELFLDLRQRASNEWQTAEALAHVCVAASRIGANPQALAAVREILEVRPSDRCEFILDQISRQEFPDQRQQIEALLANRYIPPQRPLPEDGENIALLNGDFELSLNSYWYSGGDQPLVWWNEAGCKSNAKLTQETQHSGRYSLRIQHDSAAKDGQIGHMHQVVPTTQGSTYRLEFWAKSRGANDNTLQIRVGPSRRSKLKTLLSLPAETSKRWSKFEAQFEAASDSTRVEIVSMDQGVVWLDDLQVSLVLDPQQPERVSF